MNFTLYSYEQHFLLFNNWNSTPVISGLIDFFICYRWRMTKNAGVHECQRNQKYYNEKYRFDCIHMYFIWFAQSQKKHESLSILINCHLPRISRLFHAYFISIFAMCEHSVTMACGNRFIKIDPMRELLRWKKNTQFINWAKVQIKVEQTCTRYNDDGIVR